MRAADRISVPLFSVSYPVPDRKSYRMEAGVVSSLRNIMTCPGSSCRRPRQNATLEIWNAPKLSPNTTLQMTFATLFFPFASFCFPMFPLIPARRCGNGRGMAANADDQPDE